MKRTPLKRRTPLRRSKAITPARSRVRRMSKKRTKYARRERDLPRMAWIKTQPCCLARPLQSMPPEWLGGLSPCPTMAAGHGSEAHHAGVRGLGQKADDDTCIPLCSFHHAALTDRRVPFRGWPRGAVKAWELVMVGRYRALYDAEMADRSVERSDDRGALY